MGQHSNSKADQMAQTSRRTVHTTGSGDDFDGEAGSRVWSLKDLNMHEIQKPVAVIVAGVYEDAHR